MRTLRVTPVRGALLQFRDKKVEQDTRPHAVKADLGTSESLRDRVATEIPVSHVPMTWRWTRLLFPKGGCVSVPLTWAGSASRSPLVRGAYTSLSRCAFRAEREDLGRR